MSNVIVLSDSDESVSPVDSNACVDKINKKYDSDVTSDIDLPEVPFCLGTEDSASQSDENLYDLNDDPKRGSHRSPYAMSDSQDSEDDCVKKPLRKTTASKKNKTALQEEQLKRRQALARDKALRAIASKKSRDMKPGECIKFMEVNLDQGIDVFSFRTEIQSVLRDANVSFNVTAELIPNSITWRRNIEENYVDENNETRVRRSVQTEKYAIVIWSSYEAVKHVADGTLCESISNCKALLPDYSVTLVIFGTKEYFAYRNKAKESSPNTGSRRSRCKGKGNQRFATFPVISRQQLEMCLTETQIVAKCNSRLIENGQDLALMIYQYTKSISEIPYKLQKKESLDRKFDWYVAGDNRNTVRMDRDGNGLKRLWQQQLCQFNLCSLETAEAICFVYPSPMQLIKVLLYVYFVLLLKTHSMYLYT